MKSKMNVYSKWKNVWSTIICLKSKPATIMSIFITIVCSMNYHLTSRAKCYFKGIFINFALNTLLKSLHLRTLAHAQALLVSSLFASFYNNIIYSINVNVKKYCVLQIDAITYQLQFLIISVRHESVGNWLCWRWLN